MHVLMVTHWGLSVGVLGARFLPFSEVWFLKKPRKQLLVRAGLFPEQELVINPGGCKSVSTLQP